MKIAAYFVTWKNHEKKTGVEGLKMVFNVFGFAFRQMNRCSGKLKDFFFLSKEFCFFFLLFFIQI